LNKQLRKSHVHRLTLNSLLLPSTLLAQGGIKPRWCKGKKHHPLLIPQLLWVIWGQDLTSCQILKFFNRL